MVSESEINQQWKEIINTMNEGLVLIGTDGTILMVNHAMERLTGYDREDMIGHSCTLFNCDTCEIARSKGKDKWCLLFEQGSLNKKRCLLMRKDGSYLHALKNATILKDSEGRVQGAVETVTDISELDRRGEAIETLSRMLESDGEFHGIVGKSPAMRRVFEITEKAAQSDAPVIIYGDTGTGKELVARAIHDLGRRKQGPYIQLNCAALNESLLESELFGHVKGAFTGAYSHREGRFEAAHGGDLFLDEIGDVPVPIQVKLLRVLETSQFERVGDHRPIKVDVRIITATNRNLEELVGQGKFREDFFFRINVIPIRLPPLRERMEDIPLLAEMFVKRLRKKSGKNIAGLNAEAMKLFMNHHWPGNVRELKSTLEYAFVIAQEGLIEPDHLPAQMAGGAACPPCPATGAPPAGPPAPAADERTALIEALRQSGGNQSQAARILGISRVTVWNRIRKYGIDIQRVVTP
jgi:PAS domain S-box-containing protein